MDTLSYARANASRFEAALIDLLRIPSISTLPEHVGDVERAASWVIDEMRRIGLTRAEIFQKPGYLPLVYGEWLGAGENAPTVLIYCHYDVQPARLADGWTSEPFVPTARDGKLYARGALDSKLHVIAHLKAAESLLASGGLKVNLKLLFEGEEESGSEHIIDFVAEQAELLRADVCVVSDGSMPDPGQPVLPYALRGIVGMELVVTGPKRDLHSGHYGGSVHNPIQALAEIMAALHDESGRVTVPGFYDAVRPVDDEERAALAAIEAWTAAEWEMVAGAPSQWGEPGYTLHERIGARPTLEFNGISGGFQGEGTKTVIPAQASVKITCRLVPDQDPQHMYALVRDYIQSITPPTVQAELRLSDLGAPGILLDRHTQAMQAAMRAYEQAWGRRPLFSREGGSVPVIAALKQALACPLVIMPFGYKGGGAHSTDEFIYPEMLHKGIHTAIDFYRRLAEDQP
jgi:acetylornithine deacetylase/succinyl-diaminopimelate desuccinylase-like protein